MSEGENSAPRGTQAPDWYEDGKSETEEGYQKCKASYCGLQDVRPGKVQCVFQNGYGCYEEMQSAHNYTKYLLQETLRALEPSSDQLKGDDRNLIPVYLSDPEQSPIKGDDNE